MCAEKFAKDWWKMSLSRAFFYRWRWIREAATMHYGTIYTQCSVDCQWCLGRSMPFFVLVDPYPFYCIKGEWIDQNKKGYGSTKTSLTVHTVCRYIRTYLFRRFPALNSIHPFWPTRLWEMISGVVPLNFLFLALLRIYTYDILLHRRFLHFYDFLMIYENSSNFLLKLYDSSDFLSTQIFMYMYFCGCQTLKMLS